MKKISSVLLIVFFSFSITVEAKDIGTLGEVYPISEKSILETIQDRLLKKEKTGELYKFNEQFLEKGKSYAKRPKGVSLPSASKYKVTQIDPVYIVPEDIMDAEGRVIYKAGFRINPLELKPLNKALCFLDGDDVKQVEWVIKHCGSNPINKLILVNGNILELGSKYDRRFYFDQGGYIHKRFSIKALPAVVRQQGLTLYVEEFKIK